MRVTILASFAGAALLLASCGGGGGGGLAQRPPPAGGSSASAPPAAPSPSPYDRGAATTPYGGDAKPRVLGGMEPTNTDASGQIAIVGSPDISRASEHFAQNVSGSHDGADVGHLRLRDGTSASELLRYLRADASYRNVNKVRRWASPPTVRLAEGASEKDVFDTLMAVRLINSSLPADWQLRFDETPSGSSGRHDTGIIKVSVTPRENWAQFGTGCEQAVGCAWTVAQSDGQITAATVALDPVRVTGDRKRVFVLLHELVHALGRGHVDPAAFPDTIMHASGDHGVSDWLILSPLDEAAMYAVHARLRPGTRGNLDMNDLGPWSDVSTHVFGRIDYVPGKQQAVAFGAVWQNGLVRPYAMARNPSPPLQRRLAGNASWSGRLLGMTPQAEAVAGRNGHDDPA